MVANVEIPETETEPSWVGLRLKKPSFFWQRLCRCWWCLRLHQSLQLDQILHISRGGRSPKHGKYLCWKKRSNCTSSASRGLKANRCRGLNTSELQPPPSLIPCQSWDQFDGRESSYTEDRLLECLNCTVKVFMTVTQTIGETFEPGRGSFIVDCGASRALRHWAALVSKLGTKICASVVGNKLKTENWGSATFIRG